MATRNAAPGFPLRLAAQMLFALNAIVWVALGASTLMRLAIQGQAELSWVLAALMAGNAGAMAFCAWGLGRRKKQFDILALGVMAVNIVLTITDQFGMLDLLTLLLDLILLILVLRILFPESKINQV